MSNYYCKSCLYPASKPDLWFKDGICGACHSFNSRSKYDWKNGSKVFKDLISRVTSQAWTDAEVYNAGKTSTGYKSKAATLRNIFHRIKYGDYIEGDDLNRVHESNLFMQNFSQY